MWDRTSQRTPRALSALVRDSRSRLCLDEVVGHLPCDVVGILHRRRLHEVRARTDECSTDAAIDRELAAPHRVDDDAGGVRRVPHFELELDRHRRSAEAVTFEADVRPLAIVEPWDVIRRTRSEEHTSELQSQSNL